MCVHMTSILTVLLMMTMLAVLGVLIAGFIGVARGGNPRRSNRLMRWRVMLQGLALFIFVLLMLSRR
jgi:Hypoxia induced protein conserved region